MEEVSVACLDMIVLGRKQTESGQNDPFRTNMASPRRRCRTETAADKAISVNEGSWSQGTMMHPRQRREPVTVISDCMTVAYDDGLYYYKANPAEDLTATCGLYLFTDPDKLVEIELTHLDISCEDGGLLSMVDGWEMGGEFMPSPSDHPLPLDERIVSKCGHRVEKTLFRSSQNGALVQYRVPTPGQGFALRVHYAKNPKPCNILADGTSGVYALSNHGRAINCSFTNMFPSVVSVLSLDVGATPARLFGHAPRSNGVTHNCEEKGMTEYLQIGVSTGMDAAKMAVADSVCGQARNIHNVEHLICGITTVRLVSSGSSVNVAHFNVRPPNDEDSMSASFMCDA